MPLAEQAVTAALKGSGIALDDIDHVIVTGSHDARREGARRGRSAPGPRPSSTTSPTEVGNTGTAHWALLLADVLDRAEPGQQIAVVLLADGCDVWLLRATDLLPAHRQAVSVRDRIAATRDDLTYPQFLTWRGFLEREPPRRPEPDRPAAPPSARTDAWKYAFVGSRDASGFVYLPPSRVSMTSGDDRPDGAGPRWPTCRRRSPRSPSTAWRSA